MASEYEALARVLSKAWSERVGEPDDPGADSWHLTQAQAVVAYLTSDEAVGRGYAVFMNESGDHPVARFRAAILAALGVSE